MSPARPPSGEPLEPVIERHLGSDDLLEALRADALAGLTATPKELPPKWFYDERGSALFDAITRLPEYYPTRREREILLARAREIAATARPDTFVELGSGTSEKTRILLDAFREEGALERFVPFDVCEPAIEQAGKDIAAEYPGLRVHGLVADFERHLDTLPAGDRRLIAFLGGTIGNLFPPQRAAFLEEIARDMGPDDWLLLGTDLVKDVKRLEAAYDDTAGVTAEFNRNVLAVLNRNLAAEFDPTHFDHIARYDPHNEWIEMRLRARATHRVPVAALNIVAEFTEGEEMRTEISAKFRPERVQTELATAGLELTHWWTDPAADFALSLSRKAPNR